MTTSPAVEAHPLAEELLQQVHEQRRSRLCGQCGERGNQAIAVGACAECSTELCQVCINVSENTSRRGQFGTTDSLQRPADQRRRPGQRHRMA